MFIQSKDLGLLLCLLVFVNTDLVQASFKRGLSNASGFYKCNDLDQFGSNIAWWYDWQIKSGYHANKYGCTNTLRSNHIPMSNKWDESNSNWLFRNTESSDYVLGFNEPNHHSQANMSPQQAATNWRELEEAGKTVFGAQYFVSPSATPGPADKATDYIKWFDYFFGNCTDCQIDYLATHYFSWNCDANEVMTFLSGLWQRYSKKIWLTEFACPRATVDASDQLSFMTAILPQLEAADHVYRYAWYTGDFCHSGPFWQLPAVHILAMVTMAAQNWSQLGPLWRLPVEAIMANAGMAQNDYGQIPLATLATTGIFSMGSEWLPQKLSMAK